MSKEEFVSSDFAASTILLAVACRACGFAEIARIICDDMREVAKGKSDEEFIAIKEEYYDYMMANL